MTATANCRAEINHWRHQMVIQLQQYRDSMQVSSSTRYDTRSGPITDSFKPKHGDEIQFFFFLSLVRPTIRCIPSGAAERKQLKNLIPAKSLTSPKKASNKDQSRIDCDWPTYSLLDVIAYLPPTPSSPSPLWPGSQ